MLERVKKGDRLLDLGCAFGQELRQLVSPAESMLQKWPSLIVVRAYQC